MIPINSYFERMMTLHHETFQDAHYSAAYHLLAAALHCADDSLDSQQMALVGTIAAQQLTWIDANAPAYEHSTYSAALRGHSSIYAMLARQAQGKVLVLKRKQQWNERPQFRISVQDAPELTPTD